MIAGRPVARFDDLRAGTAIAWPQLDGLLVAHRDEDVAPLHATFSVSVRQSVPAGSTPPTETALA